MRRLPASKLAAAGRLISAPLLIPPSCMPLHAPCRHDSPNSPAAIRSNHGNQIMPCTRLAKDCPTGFAHATAPGANNPGWMAIFINDLFDLFWLNPVPGNVFNVVVIPLRLQLPELHRLKLAQENAAFEDLMPGYLASCKGAGN